MARHKQISCFSPVLKLEPDSDIGMSRPPLVEMRESREALPKSSKMVDSELRPSGSRLNLRVPVKSVGSWGIRVILLLIRLSGSVAISTPSMSICPLSTSMILLMARLIVLFPAPVRPTTPIFSPGRTSKLRSLRTVSVFGRYFNMTFLNSRRPSSGHEGRSYISSPVMLS